MGNVLLVWLADVWSFCAVGMLCDADGRHPTREANDAKNCRMTIEGSCLCCISYSSFSLCLVV